VVALLITQGDVSVRAVASLSLWAHGELAQAQHVRALEHEADDARRAVLSALRRAFSTPIEPEDLFELSERLDAVVNQAKDLVREAEVLAMEPDSSMAAMADFVVVGVRELVSCFPLLAGNPDSATDAADRAIHQVRSIERSYRSAMSELLEVSDVRQLAGRRELYRRLARIADAVERVADRVWYAVVKRA
jgi:hypothetical protein